MANATQAMGARYAQALTKSDTTTYQPPMDALYIGGAGAAAVVTEDGQTVTFSGLVAGTILPVRFTKLMSTNTDATLCVGLRF
jgi:hypothetical protein